MDWLRFVTLDIERFGVYLKEHYSYYDKRLLSQSVEDSRQLVTKFPTDCCECCQKQPIETTLVMLSLLLHRDADAAEFGIELTKEVESVDGGVLSFGPGTFTAYPRLGMAVVAGFSERFRLPLLQISRHLSPSLRRRVLSQLRSLLDQPNTQFDHLLSDAFVALVAAGNDCGQWAFTASELHEICAIRSMSNATACTLLNSTLRYYRIHYGGGHSDAMGAHDDVCEVDKQLLHQFDDAHWAVDAAEWSSADAQGDVDALKSLKSLTEQLATIAASGPLHQVHDDVVFALTLHVRETHFEAFCDAQLVSRMRSFADVLDCCCAQRPKQFDAFVERVREHLLRADRFACRPLTLSDSLQLFYADCTRQPPAAHLLLPLLAEDASCYSADDVRMLTAFLRTHLSLLADWSLAAQVWPLVAVFSDGQALLRDGFMAMSMLEQNEFCVRNWSNESRVVRVACDAAALQREAVKFFNRAGAGSERRTLVGQFLWLCLDDAESMMHRALLCCVHDASCLSYMLPMLHRCARLCGASLPDPSHGPAAPSSPDAAQCSSCFLRALNRLHLRRLSAAQRDNFCQLIAHLCKPVRDPLLAEKRAICLLTLDDWLLASDCFGADDANEATPLLSDVLDECLTLIGAGKLALGLRRPFVVVLSVYQLVCSEPSYRVRLQSVVAQLVGVLTDVPPADRPAQSTADLGLLARYAHAHNDWPLLCLLQPILRAYAVPFDPQLPPAVAALLSNDTVCLQNFGPPTKAVVHQLLLFAQLSDSWCALATQKCELWLSEIKCANDVGNEARRSIVLALSDLLGAEEGLWSSRQLVECLLGLARGGRGYFGTALLTSQVVEAMLLPETLAAQLLTEALVVSQFSPPAAAAFVSAMQTLHTLSAAADRSFEQQLSFQLHCFVFVAIAWQLGGDNAFGVLLNAAVKGVDELLRRQRLVAKGRLLVAQLPAVLVCLLRKFLVMYDATLNADAAQLVALPPYLLKIH